MAIQQRADPQPWYAKYEKIVQWATLGIVVLGGIAHYLLVDLPSVRSIEESRRLTQQMTEESKKNQVLLEQRLIEAKANTDALVANVDQIKSQIELARATIDQITDPMKKASDRLTLAKQRVEQTRSIDELIESLRPNIQVSMAPIIPWHDFGINIPITIKNASSRSIIVDQPVISVTMNPNPDPVAAQRLPRLPHADEITTSICQAGAINPGDAFPCAAIVSSKVSTGGVMSLSFSVKFAARTDIAKESNTWKMISAEYPRSYFESKFKTTQTFNGTVTH